MRADRGDLLEGYDVIGDVHGCHDHLLALLAALGYDDDRGAHRHPTRQAVFVGDLVDRGPGQVEVLRLVRAMVEAGTARIVMGNHEFNAVAFATEDPRRPGVHLRPRSDKNVNQHVEFLAQIRPGSADHAEAIAWFSTLPMWLDLGDLRVVHACWDDRAISGLGDPRVLPEHLVAASTKDTDEYRWVETLCKGPEVDLPPGYSYVDAGGHARTNARYRWWDPRTGTYADALETPGDQRFPDEPIADPPVAPYDAEVPVVFGHYWQRWPEGDRCAVDMTARAVCTDFSAVKDGPLVAYRWSGEQDLTPDHLVAARP